MSCSFNIRYSFGIVDRTHGHIHNCSCSCSPSHCSITNPYQHSYSHSSSRSVCFRTVPTTYRWPLHDPSPRSLCSCTCSRSYTCCYSYRYCYGCTGSPSYLMNCTGSLACLPLMLSIAYHCRSTLVWPAVLPSTSRTSREWPRFFNSTPHSFS